MFLLLPERVKMIDWAKIELRTDRRMVKRMLANSESRTCVKCKKRSLKRMGKIKKVKDVRVEEFTCYSCVVNNAKTKRTKDKYIKIHLDAIFG